MEGEGLQSKADAVFITSEHQISSALLMLQTGIFFFIPFLSRAKSEGRTRLWENTFIFVHKPHPKMCVCVCRSQVMKTYHMYNTDSINAESKLKDAEKQEEKQMGRSGRQEDRQTPRSPDTLTSIKSEEKPVRRSSVKKIEKMKEKVRAVSQHPTCSDCVCLMND